MMSERVIFIFFLIISLFTQGQEFESYSIDGLNVINEFVVEEDSTAESSYNGLQKVWWSEDYRFAITQSSQLFTGAGLKLWDVENRVILKSFKTEKFEDANYYSISNNIASIDIGQDKITVVDDENIFILDISTGLIEFVKPQKSKIDDTFGKEYVKGNKINVTYHRSMEFNEPDYFKVNGKNTIKLPEGTESLKFMSLSAGDSVLVSVHYSYQVAYQTLLLHNVLSGDLIGSYSIIDEPLNGAHFIKENSELIIYTQKGRVSVIDFKNTDLAINKRESLLQSIPQSGHASLIKTIEFSSDGKSLLSSDKNGTVLNWDWQRGIHRSPRFFENLTGVSLADINTNDIVVYDYHKTELVDCTSGKVKYIIENTGIDVAYNKDCSLLVYSVEDYYNSNNNGIYTVDFKSKKQKRVFKELKKYNTVTPIALNSKGSLVVIDCMKTNGDRFIELVSLKTGKSIRSLSYDGLIVQASFNSEDQLAIGFNRNGIIILDCNNKTAEPIKIVPSGEFGNIIRSVVADKRHVYASGNFGRIGVWNLTDGKKIEEILHYDKPPSWFEKNKTYNPNFNVIQSLDVSTDGNYLASSSHRGTIKVWSLENFEEIQTLTSRVSKVTGVNFEANDQFFRVSNSSGGDSFGESELEPDSTVKRIDFQDLKISGLNGHRFNVSAIKTAKSNGVFVSIDNMNGLKFWNNSNNVVNTLYFDVDLWFDDMELSPNGEYFAISFGGSSDTNRVQIYSTSTFEQLINWEFVNGSYSTSNTPLDFLSENELLFGTDKGIFKVDILKKSVRKWKKHDFGEQRIQDIDVGIDNVIVKLNYNAFSFAKNGDFEKEYSLLSPFEYGGRVVSTDNTEFYLFDEKKLSKVMKYNLQTSSFSAPMSHPSPTTSADIMNNKMIVGTYGGACYLWDLLNQEVLAKFIPNKNQEMSVITEEGFYYLSDKTEMQSIAFQYGEDLFPLSQFDLKYNRPDIVLERLGYASPEKITSYRRAYEKRLQKMGFTEDMLKADFHLPEASITNEDELPVQLDAGQLTLKIKATDSKYPLDRINVWINNVPMFGVNGISLRDKNTQDYKTEMELQLNEGDNKIEVSVLNQAGAESYKKTVYIKCTKPAPKPNLYFVGIGVKDYVNEDMNLKYSDKDIRDVANLYGSSSAYGKVYIDTFLNVSATKNILPKIRQKLESTTIHDQVIFMYSGHGILDDSLDYYLTTHDIDFLNPSTKGIPYEAVDELLDNIPARQKLVLIDACNSGEVDKDEMEVDNTTGITAEVIAPKGAMFKKYATKTNSFEMMQELFTDLRRGTGATVISSSSGKYFSFEDKKYQNGVYTYALKLGLEGAADANSDDEISVSELKEFLYTKVESLTNGKQKPTARQENLEYDFRVW